MAWVSNTNGFAYNGSLLSELIRMFPKFAFSCGIHPETRRHCIFVYTHVDRGTNIPADEPIAAIEAEGSSKEAFDLLVTKLMMVCG